MFKSKLTVAYQDNNFNLVKEIQSNSTLKEVEISKKGLHKCDITITYCFGPLDEPSSEVNRDSGMSANLV